MFYLWAKALHIVFVASWFAGLFYLPRIFVNLAMETNDAARARLLLMGRKLYRFTTIIAVPALVFGLYLFLVLGIGKGAGWMHAKLVIVVLTLIYHHMCGRLLKAFEQDRNQHGHKWYRYFNELPVFALLGAVLLVVIKPF